MRHSPTDLSRDGPQRQTLIAQFDDLPNYRLLLWYLDNRAVHTDQPTEGRGAAEKASALLLAVLPVPALDDRKHRRAEPARGSSAFSRT
jgi:hypothetical protein